MKGRNLYLTYTYSRYREHKLCEVKKKICGE